MPNPLINQGTLNRIRGSLTVSNFPALNITAPYMGKGMLSISKEGNASDLIATATGGVPSPEPYQFAVITVNLLKTNALAQLWEDQIKSSSTIGPIKCFTDAAPYGPFEIDNCVIENLQPGAFSGTEPTINLTIRGIYNINDSLWNF